MLRSRMANEVKIELKLIELKPPYQIVVQINSSRKRLTVEWTQRPEMKTATKGLSEHRKCIALSKTRERLTQKPIRLN